MKKSLLLITLILSLMVIISCEPEAEQHEHVWGEWTESKASTCTEEGISIRKCTSCGEQDAETQVIKALGHSLSENATEITGPTCVLSGKETFCCTREGCDYSETKEIPATGHSYKWKDQGSSGHCQRCTVCSVDTATTAHSFGEWITDTDSTEEEEGKKHRVCSVCVYKEEGTIPLKGHTHVASADFGFDETSHWKKCTKSTCTEELEVTNHGSLTENTVKTATCLEDGEKILKCSICGYEKKETVTKLGHDWDDGSITTVATCVKTGIMTFNCERTDCSGTKTEIISATGVHTASGAEQVVEATCTNSGRRYKICSDCNAEFDITTIDALGHTWSEWATKTDGTCNVKATLSQTCSKCNLEETKDGDYDASNHPENSLIWKSGGTVSFLTKTEKKKYCEACNKYTGQTKQDYDSIEGYWVVNETGNETTSYYSFDGESSAYNYLVLKNSLVSVDQISNEQKYTFAWTTDESYPQKRTGFKLSFVNNGYTTTDNWMITSEDTTGENPSITIQSTSTYISSQSSITLVRQSTETHYEHSYSDNKNAFLHDEIGSHYIPTSCDSSWHGKLYKVDSHSYDTERVCTICGYGEPYGYSIECINNAEGSAETFGGNTIERGKKFSLSDSYSITVNDSNGNSVTYTFSGIEKWTATNYDSSGQLDEATTKTYSKPFGEIEIEGNTNLSLYYATKTTTEGTV